MPGTKLFASRHSDASHFVQARHLLARKPEPPSGLATGLALSRGLMETALDGLSHLRHQAGGLKILVADEKILGKGFAVRLESHDAPTISGQLPLQFTGQA